MSHEWRAIAVLIGALAAILYALAYGLISRYLFANPPAATTSDPDGEQGPNLIAS